MWGFALERAIPTLITSLRGHCIQRVAVGSSDNILCLTGPANDVYNWQFEVDDNASSEQVPKVI